MSLSDTQLVILSTAAQRDDLRIILPERLRGGAADKMLSTLLGKGLIEMVPADELERPTLGGDAPERGPYRISPCGLAAIGLGGEVSVEAEQTGNANAETRDGDMSTPLLAGAAVATRSASASTKPPRAGSKLETVMALLARADGASIDELTATTGWLPHTTRAALTGLRKRGIAIERGKRADGSTTYRVPAAIAPVEVP